MENITCIICDNGNNEECLMLCDGCNRGFHTTCLNMISVPVNDWYCSKCIKNKLSKFKLDFRSIVYLYERISSKGQDNVEHGRVGLDTQNTMLLKYATDNGLIIEKTIRETESAYRINPKRNRLLVTALNNLKKNECLLVYSVSRFSRNLKEGLFLLQTLKNKDAYVYSVTENVYSYEDAFINLIKIAEDESMNLGLKIKTANIRIRNLGGHIGVAPFGYVTFRDSNGIRRLKTSDSEQYIIEQIRNEKPTISFVNKLNLTSNNRGRKWTLYSVKRLHNKYNETKNNKRVNMKTKKITKKATSINRFIDEVRNELINCETNNQELNSDNDVVESFMEVID